MRLFDRLDAETKAAIKSRTAFRQARFIAKEIPTKGSVLLVGDRPAPDAPDDPQFHYTPFGAEHHSSLWLNLQLHQARIPEERLFWANAFDHKGNPSDPSILQHSVQLVALGGNANKWIRENKHLGHWQFQHPQAWKRFHSKEPYPLIECLSLLCQS